MDAIRRSSIGFGILVIVWIVVYWWWEPTPRAVAIDRAAPSGISAGTPGPSADQPSVSGFRNEPSAERREPARTNPPPSRPPPDPAPTNPSASETVRGVEAPVFRSYTVRSGDTFEIIARRELGSSSHASAIARSNPLLDPTRLRQGQTIRIPIDPRNIQGRDVSGVPASDVRGPLPEYTVKPGDTLGDISKAVYGSSAHWRTILDANRGVLRDEKSLRPGQRLVIPPLGDSAPGPR